MNDKLTKAETAVAVILTIVAIWLRLLTAFSAGALWRDEANTVAVSTLPSIGDVWRNLQYDSFPILWIIIVRCFSMIAGPMNDVAFRGLGFVVGAGMIGAVWWYARTLRVCLPLLSLLLVGLTPSIIVWGDSVRAYGAGIVLMIITGALLWRYIERPTAVRLAFAAVAALASVHTTYYNSVLLLAFGLGAIAVCWKRKDFRTAAGVIGIGLLAAISLVVYVPVIEAAAKWNDVVRMPRYTIDLFWAMLKSTLWRWQAWLWAGLSIAAVVAAMRSIQKEIVLFSTVTLIASVIGVFLFLRALSYPTDPWYYISMLAISAVCIDAIFGTIVHADMTRVIRLAGISVVAIRMMLPVAGAVSARMTRVDGMADRIGKEANAGDFVVVNPWFVGVTFDRYYRGSTPWETVPPIGFHAYHRYDLIRQKLLMPNHDLAIASLEDQMRAALSTGHRVFVVGDIPQSTQVVMPETPRAIPPGQIGLLERGYEVRLGLLVARFLGEHATAIEQVTHSAPGSTNPFETARLRVATGWRP